MRDAIPLLVTNTYDNCEREVADAVPMYPDEWWEEYPEPRAAWVGSGQPHAVMLRFPLRYPRSGRTSEEILTDVIQAQVRVAFNPGEGRLLPRVPFVVSASRSCRTGAVKCRVRLNI